VLADPRASGAQAVVVGGDAVPGPFAVDTVARLRALEVPVHWVRGNGEREVAAAADGGDPPAPDDMALVTAGLSAAQLGPEEAAALGALPLSIELDGVLYCHASPRRDDETLTRISAPERWEAALAGVTSALVVAGHTHQQDDRRIGAVRCVNAGSVGLPYEGRLGAYWLWVDAGEPQVHVTAYDAPAAAARMLAAGWPDTESIDAALVDPVEATVVTELFEGQA